MNVEQLMVLVQGVPRDGLVNYLMNAYQGFDTDNLYNFLYRCVIKVSVNPLAPVDDVYSFEIRGSSRLGDGTYCYRYFIRHDSGTINKLIDFFGVTVGSVLAMATGVSIEINVTPSAHRKMSNAGAICTCEDWGTYHLFHEPEFINSDVPRYRSMCECRMNINEVDTERESAYVHDYNYNLIEGFRRDGKDPFLPNRKYHQRYFGLEIEMEFPDHMNDRSISSRERAKIVKEIHGLTKDFAIMKSDGSLNETSGVELVSRPATLGWWKEKLCISDSEVFSKIAQLGMRSHYTTTCGTHVHVTRPLNRDMMMGRLNSMFYKGHRTFRDMVFLVSQRNRDSLNRWARMDLNAETSRREILDAKDIELALARAGVAEDIDALYRFKQSLSMNKYLAINETENTVEFRIFRGNLNPRRIQKNIEFCDACFEFCDHHPLLVSPTRDQFLSFVNKNKKKWPELHAFSVNNLNFKGAA